MLTVNLSGQLVSVFQVAGLYKGISSPLAGLAFINAIVFGVYGNTLKSLGENGDAIRSHFIAGKTFSSGCFANVVWVLGMAAILGLALEKRWWDLGT